MIRFLIVFHALSLFIPQLLCAQTSAATFKIALLTELSGSNAVNGQGCREGFEVARKAFAARDVLGDHRLEFFYGDSQGLPAAGVNEFKKLLSVNEAQCVISTRSQIGMAINPISRQRKVPLLGIVGHADFVSNNPYAFRFWPTVKLEGAALAKKAIELGKQKIAAVSLEDEWTLALLQEFRLEFEKLGGELVYSVEIAPRDSDMAAIAAKIKQAAPDAIFVNLALAQSGPLMKKIRELKMPQQFFTNFWAANADTIANTGDAVVEGLVYVASDLNKKRFINRIKEEFGHSNVTAVTYSCYSAMAASAEALRSCQKPCTGETFHSAMKKLTVVPLLDEQLQIKDREAQFHLSYMTVRNGQVVPL